MHPSNYDEQLKAKLWNPDHYDRMIYLHPSMVGSYSSSSIRQPAAHLRQAAKEAGGSLVGVG